MLGGGQLKADSRVKNFVQKSVVKGSSQRFMMVSQSVRVIKNTFSIEQREVNLICLTCETVPWRLTVPEMNIPNIYVL